MNTTHPTLKRVVSSVDSQSQDGTMYDVQYNFTYIVFLEIKTETTLTFLVRRAWGGGCTRVPQRVTAEGLLCLVTDAGTYEW